MTSVESQVLAALHLQTMQQIQLSKGMQAHIQALIDTSKMLSQEIMHALARLRSVNRTTGHCPITSLQRPVTASCADVQPQPAIALTDTVAIAAVCVASSRPSGAGMSGVVPMVVAATCPMAGADGGVAPAPPRHPLIWAHQRSHVVSSGPASVSGSASALASASASASASALPLARRSPQPCSSSPLLASSSPAGPNTGGRGSRRRALHSSRGTSMGRLVVPAAAAAYVAAPSSPSSSAGGPCRPASGAAPAVPTAAVSRKRKATAGTQQQPEAAVAWVAAPASAVAALLPPPPIPPASLRISSHSFSSTSGTSGTSSAAAAAVGAAPAAGCPLPPTGHLNPWMLTPAYFSHSEVLSSLQQALMPPPPPAAGAAAAAAASTTSTPSSAPAAAASCPAASYPTAPATSVPAVGTAASAVSSPSITAAESMPLQVVYGSDRAAATTSRHQVLYRYDSDLVEDPIAKAARLLEQQDSGGSSGDSPFQPSSCEHVLDLGYVGWEEVLQDLDLVV